MSARQTIVSTGLLLFLALFSIAARDVAQAEERWPPWQSFTEAEEAARQKALRRKKAAAQDLVNLKRQAAQLEAAGKYAQAEPLARRYLERVDRKGANSIVVADALESLGRILAAQGKAADAEPLLKRSVGLREKAPGQPGLAAAREQLAAVYDKLGKGDEALAMRRGVQPDTTAAEPEKEVAAKPAEEPKPVQNEAPSTEVEAPAVSPEKPAAEEPFSIPSADAPSADAPPVSAEADDSEAKPSDQDAAAEPFSIPSADAPSADAAPPPPPEAEVTSEDGTEKSAGAESEAPATSDPAGGSGPAPAAEAPAPAPPPVAEPDVPDARPLPKYSARRMERPRIGGPRAAEPPPAAARAPSEDMAAPSPPPPPPAVVAEPSPQPMEGGSGAGAQPSTGMGQLGSGGGSSAEAPAAAAPSPSENDGMGAAAAPEAVEEAPKNGAAATDNPEAMMEAAPPAAGGAAPSGGAAVAPQVNPDYQVVPVYWGTDRAVQPNAQRLAFGSDRARKLQLGVAEITVPKVHEVPNVERPWVVKIPYFDVTLYAEKEDAKKHFTVKDIKALTKEELLAQVRERLKTSSIFKDQALVFVHGYNTSFDNALYRTAQIAYDLDFDGAPFVYSWPSGGAVASYTYDRESAQASEPYLRQFLEMVAKETGAKKVSIIAHSMGNQPVMDVLRDMRNAAPEGVEISQVILAAPDVDADNFANLANAIKGLATNVTLYVASNDRALIVSRNFWGSYRAGDVPPAGPLILPGIDTIDVTAASTDAFAINHSGYAANNKLLSDIAELLKTGLRPPEMRALKPGKVTTNTGDYWRYVPVPQ
ncbi:alpha/beta hydrolase [Hyphomicrobium sp. NDB2Meth4]|uniref:alpha/beta hydrolase n=1 Tax=Hyphomicrobium sp. NDB2Meth4 TaxID=1892846 RepID=UPI000AA297B3|nr:alpha/beta hydrolase [Hyphomicrobium sp. NDB2Meth4]